MGVWRFKSEVTNHSFERLETRGRADSGAERPGEGGLGRGGLPEDRIRPLGRRGARDEDASAQGAEQAPRRTAPERLAECASRQCAAPAQWR